MPSSHYQVPRAQDRSGFYPARSPRVPKCVPARERGVCVTEGGVVNTMHLRVWYVASSRFLYLIQVLNHSKEANGVFSGARATYRLAELHPY